MATQREIDRYNIDLFIARLLKMGTTPDIFLAVQNESNSMGKGNKAKIPSDIWDEYYKGIQALAGFLYSGIKPSEENQVKFKPLIDKLEGMKE